MFASYLIITGSILLALASFCAGLMIMLRPRYRLQPAARGIAARPFLTVLPLQRFAAALADRAPPGRLYPPIG